MDNPRDFTAFRRLVRAWYKDHARILPWRKNPTPYRVWISEIMLQQTTTTTVGGYFDRFMTAFPDVSTLARSSEEEVLKYWQGLGYYRRARQLREAAIQIVNRFNGVFPETRPEIESLPGIGRYTAGAIASIACNLREPILETNTVRLHCRLTGWARPIQEKESLKFLWQFAEDILPNRECGPFNQALMDLGSTICRVESPQCLLCPVTRFCEAAHLGIQSRIPVLPPKAKKEGRLEIALAFSKAPLDRGKSASKRYLLIRYPDGFRWAGLWDFPRFLKTSDKDLDRDDTLIQVINDFLGQNVQLETPPIMTLRHVVTRFLISLQFCRCVPVPCSADGSDKPVVQNHRIVTLAAGTGPNNRIQRRWCTLAEAAKLPMSTTGKKLLDGLGSDST